MDLWYRQDYMYPVSDMRSLLSLSNCYIATHAGIIFRMCPAKMTLHCNIVSHWLSLTQNGPDPWIMTPMKYNISEHITMPQSLYIWISNTCQICELYLKLSTGPYMLQVGRYIFSFRCRWLNCRQRKIQCTGIKIIWHELFFLSLGF